MRFVSVLTLVSMVMSGTATDDGGINITEILDAVLWGFCTYTDTCQPGSLNASAAHACCPVCSCNRETCNIMGNCCPGNGDSPGNGHTSSAVECIVPSLNLHSDYDSDQNVDSHVTVNVTMTTAVGVYMVTSCAGQEADDACASPNISDIHENIPLTSITTGLTYRNVQCAACNNITDALPWIPYITCSDPNVIRSDITLFPSSWRNIYDSVVTSDNENCGVQFIPPADVDVESDKCYRNPDLRRSCDRDISGDLYDNCQTITQPYIHYTPQSVEVYANIYCFICFNVALVKELHLADKPVCTYHAELFKMENNILIGQLNYDAEPRDVNVNQTTTPVRASCQPTEVLDPYTKECRLWHCPSGSQLVGTDCLPIFTSFSNMTFQLRLQIKFDNQPVRGMTSDDKLQLMNDVLAQLFATKNYLHAHVLFLASTTTNDSFMFAIVFVKVTDPSEPVITMFNETANGSRVVTSLVNETLYMNVSFADSVRIEITNFQFQFVTAVDQQNHRILRNDYTTNVTEIQEALTYPVINKLSFCIQVVLRRSEFRDYVDIVDSRLTDMRLYSGDFIRTETNDIRVCLSDYLRWAATLSANPPQPVLVSPQAVVSVVCNIMSIAGLALTIVTYFIFGKLRSIPGKNNMMLALHLLIAQCLYQFGMAETERPQLCILLGVLIHLFWLTAILWMNACTLHMFRTFVSGQSYRSVRTCDAQVCFYTAYCYGLSAVMVSINIGVSLVRTDGSDIGYGGHICYISNPAMVGWVFALPVGLIVIMNMGFFLAVVYQISASTMTQQGKSSDRDNTVIYMKLSSLTGVTWIFGFLYIWTEFVAFEYIFIVLNAGQGVLIFISFICTQRVSKLYIDMGRKYARLLARHCACAHQPHKTPETSVVELQDTQRRQRAELANSDFDKVRSKQTSEYGRSEGRTDVSSREYAGRHTGARTNIKLPHHSETKLDKRSNDSNCIGIYRQSVDDTNMGLDKHPAGNRRVATDKHSSGDTGMAIGDDSFGQTAIRIGEHSETDITIGNHSSGEALSADIEMRVNRRSSIDLVALVEKQSNVDVDAGVDNISFCDTETSIRENNHSLGDIRVDIDE